MLSSYYDSMHKHGLNASARGVNEEWIQWNLKNISPIFGCTSCRIKMQTEEIVVIALVLGLFVFLGFCWLSDRSPGLQKCWKTRCDKYIWEPLVDLYYGLCCCHFCKYNKEKMDKDYSKVTTQEEICIQIHNSSTNDAMGARRYSVSQSNESELEDSIGLR